MNTINDDNMSEETALTWFTDTLEILGHANPCQVVKQALQNHLPEDDDVDDKEAKESFQQIIVWLEDRIIRLWTVEERMKLRRHDQMTTTSTTTTTTTVDGRVDSDDFMIALEEYLEQLECPYRVHNNHTTKTRDHDNIITTLHPIAGIKRQQQQQQRIRIMYWILSCAISESYQEQIKMNGMDKNNREIIMTKSTSTRTSPITITNKSMFPLGFTTGDPMVDDQLTLRRMHYLLQLRKEQDQINDCIASLQQATIKE